MSATTETRSADELAGARTRAVLGGLPVDLVEFDDALHEILNHPRSDDEATLAVVSVNLDHIHHFALADGDSARRPGRQPLIDSHDLRWLSLLDGAPAVREAGRLTGRSWPRLAGSDVIEPILDAAEAKGLSVGFVGGSTETHQMLRQVVATRWPALKVAGLWAPDRSELEDAAAMTELADSIRRADVDLLAVCLGKPRQERWIAQYGAQSGARVCLAFGAVVDFLAGRVKRAPRVVAAIGMEWAWRLVLEPRRLARRYLVDGPPAYLALRRGARVSVPMERALSETERRSPVGTIIIPAHNEESVIARTLAPLAELVDEGWEVIVAANGCSDATATEVAKHAGVKIIELEEGSKPGALNAADAVASKWPRLYLDADITVSADAVRAVARRLEDPALLAARPAYAYDLAGCSALVRSYYRSRRRMPEMSEHLWGAGAYALSQTGHDRLGSFPDLVADDLFVDELFERSEVAVVPTQPVVVRCPRSAAALLSTLRRVQTGKREISSTRAQSHRGAGSIAGLVHTVRGPSSLIDSFVYAGFAVASRIGRRASGVWQRDNTTRRGPGPSTARSADDR